MSQPNIREPNIYSRENTTNSANTRKANALLKVQTMNMWSAQLKLQRNELGGAVAPKMNLRMNLFGLHHE